MTEWLVWLSEITTREPCALISVLATEGSVPRGAGTRMLVTARDLHGTIGGGQLEYQAIEQARALLGHPCGSWRVQDYPLGPLLGQCCGGRVRLLIDHVDAEKLDWIAELTADSVLVTTLTATSVERHISPRTLHTRLLARGDRPSAGETFAETIGQRYRPLYLFGAGHVGQAVARHATQLPFQLAWFDTRPEFVSIGSVVIVPEDMIEDCIAGAPADAAIVILTHDHALDYRLTKAALARAPMAFIGLIGSATKKARFKSRLERDGISAAARAKLICPIGISGIVGKEPDVIAVATLAQLLQLGTP